MNPHFKIALGLLSRLLRGVKILASRVPNVAPKPRILICAPSNAAADELLQRVMNAGFHDAQVSALGFQTRVWFRV